MNDPDCEYTAAYCTIAQKEGHCKQEVIEGLYRMIAA